MNFFHYLIIAVAFVLGLLIPDEMNPLAVIVEKFENKDNKKV